VLNGYFAISRRMADSYSNNQNRTNDQVQELVTGLTPGEIEVLKLLPYGYQNKEMGEKLKLSRRTIEGYRDSMKKKLCVHTTAELIIFAIRARLIRVEGPLL
jgi:DNA-binding NarL/FixJ family response regulator